MRTRNVSKPLTLTLTLTDTHSCLWKARKDMEKGLPVENFITREKFCKERTSNYINTGVLLTPSDAMYICQYYLTTVQRNAISYTLPP
jgi:hypothetical protein